MIAGSQTNIRKIWGWLAFFRVCSGISGPKYRLTSSIRATTELLNQIRVCISVQVYSNIPVQGRTLSDLKFCIDSKSTIKIQAGYRNHELRVQTGLGRRSRFGIPSSADRSEILEYFFLKFSRDSPKSVFIANETAKLVFEVNGGLYTCP